VTNGILNGIIAGLFEDKFLETMKNLLNNHPDYQKADEIVRLNAASALQSTPQIFILNEGSCDPWGSGVLINLDGNSPNLITAEHVIREERTNRNLLSNLRIKIGENFAAIGSSAFVYSAASFSKDIDMASIPLNSDLVDRLIEDNRIFLDSNFVDFNHTVHPGLPYLSTGHPGGLRQKNKPFVLMTSGSKPEKWKKAAKNVDPTIHHLVDYRQSKMQYFNQQMSTQGPDPRGISGSGLWFMEHPSKDLPPRLIGIMTNHFKKINAIRGTRINILSAINQAI